jgi:hypothetical protein
MRVVVPLLLFLLAAETLAAPAPLPKRAKPAPIRYFEIDFSPMDALPQGYSPRGFYLMTLELRGDGPPVVVPTPNRLFSLDAKSVARLFVAWGGFPSEAKIAPCGKKVVLKADRWRWAEISNADLPAYAMPRVRCVR